MNRNQYHNLKLLQTSIDTLISHYTSEPKTLDEKFERTANVRQAKARVKAFMADLQDL